MEKTKTPKRIKATSFFEHIAKFSTEDECRAHLERMRFPDGVTCLRCGGKKVWEYSHRFEYVCANPSCQYHFTVTTGTIFHDSHIKLTKWFYAIHLIVNAKKGLSHMQLMREVGVSYKSAWFLGHRIREAMKEGISEMLKGTIESDETFIGGKAANMHKAKRARTIQGRGTVGKTAVMGILQRDGAIRTKVIPNTQAQTLQPEIKNNVAPGSKVFTDALTSYSGLAPEYVHEWVDHAIEYVRGDVHTNGVENYWSLLKRGIIGNYHHISDKHLPRYLAESEYRFNRRAQSKLFDSIIQNTNGKHLSYAQLISGREN